MKKIKVLVLLIGMSIGISSCTNVNNISQENKINVVTTTPIIADLVKNVTRDKANVVSLVPSGADPHSYEPTFRQIRDIASANIAFSNYLTLEEHSIIKMLDSNLPKEAQNIALAESSIPKGAKTINLVENQSLDTIWLGLRVEGENDLSAEDRSGQVEIMLKKVEGPGEMFGYLTESFGEPNIYFDSTKIDDRQKAVLPSNAHTHMSWAFTKPGIYKATFTAQFKDKNADKTIQIKENTFTFVVGKQANKVYKDKKIFDKNHADITVNLQNKNFEFSAATGEGDEVHKDSTQDNDNEEKHEHDKNENHVHTHKHEDNAEHNHNDEHHDAHTHDHDQEHSHTHEHHGDHEDEHLHEHESYDPKDIVIEVPNKALAQIPSEIEYKFLGTAGESIYLLPQAVLGKHVHGELDPHLWLNVENAKYYVDVIAEKISEMDRDNKDYYSKNANEYKEKLDHLHDEILHGVQEIPKENRQLITTHDSFGYFAKAYGMKIAGFVTPNPSTQPSVAERKKLTETISNLKVKAVFLEPNIIAKSSVLKQIAQEQNVQVCSIMSDTFTNDITSYIDMMKANIESMKKCLK